jgi:hypothetical protein
LAVADSVKRRHRQSTKTKQHNKTTKQQSKERQQ